MKFKAFLKEHASGIAMTLVGGVMMLSGNKNEGLALMSAGLATFGIKIGSNPK